MSTKAPKTQAISAPPTTQILKEGYLVKKGAKFKVCRPTCVSTVAIQMLPAQTWRRRLFRLYEPDRPGGPAYLAYFKEPEKVTLRDKPDLLTFPSIALPRRHLHRCHPERRG